MTSLESSSNFSDLNFIRSFPIKENFFFLDEVGRGPLAGPVVSSCVTFSVTEDNQSLEASLNFLESLGVTDSKKISAKKRKIILDNLSIELSTLETEQVYDLAFKDFSLSFCISSSSPKEIDEINILQASLLSMKRSLKSTLRQKGLTQGVALIDGNKSFEVKDISTHTLIKGDQKSKFIALSSIIAKEYRDYLMAEYSKEFPVYGFDKHSGYPTVFHKQQIAEYGLSPIHRRSFKSAISVVKK